MRQPKTKKQQAMLEFIKNFIAENGYAPSYAEIRTAYGYSSSAPVQSMLRRLKEQGFVDWELGKNRTLRIIDHDHCS